MTVSNPVNTATFTGNGLTTAFPYTFLIQTGNEEITLTDLVTGLEGSAISASLYSITGLDSPSGGTVTYPLAGAPLTSGYKINIRRVVPVEQLLDLTSQSSYNPTVLEDTLDLIVMMIAQQEEQLSRAILLGTGTVGADAIASISSAAATATSAAAAAAASAVAANASAVAAAAALGSFTAASTTEVLTSTEAVKYVTPDALAALWEKGANVASAGTLTLGEGGYFHVTGTVTITDIDFAVAVNGRRAVLVFDGALTLTHNATTLILPGGVSITTAAGDRCEVVQDAADNVYVTWYMRANGTALVAGLAAATQAEMEAASSTTVAATPGRVKYDPGVCKCWGFITLTAGVPTITVSHNTTSITDVGVGQYTVVINVDHSTGNYAILVGVDNNSTTTVRGVAYDTQFSGSFSMKVVDEAASSVDPFAFSYATFGDQ